MNPKADPPSAGQNDVALAKMLLRNVKSKDLRMIIKAASRRCPRRVPPSPMRESPAMGGGSAIASSTAQGNFEEEVGQAAARSQA